MSNENALLYEQESFKIRGAIFEVYKNLGCGFLESVYQESLEKEMETQKIPFKSQVELLINYKGIVLKQYFKADIICYESIIIELKACKAIDPVHRAQVMNYLKATGLRLGLIVNFGVYPKAVVERIVL